MGAIFFRPNLTTFTPPSLSYPPSFACDPINYTNKNIPRTQLLRYDHQERLTARDAMDHPYFQEVRANQGKPVAAHNEASEQSRAAAAQQPAAASSSSSAAAPAPSSNA